MSSGLSLYFLPGLYTLYDTILIGCLLGRLLN